MRICNRCGQVKTSDKFRTRRLYCRTCEGKSHYAYLRCRPVKMMIYSAKHRAKRDGIPFSLSEKDIKIPAVCPILGIPLHSGNRMLHDSSPTIDRIIPELGYVIGNVMIISHKANRMKSNGSLDDFRRMVKFFEYYELTDSKYAALRVPQNVALHPRFRQIKTEASIS